MLLIVLVNFVACFWLPFRFEYHYFGFWNSLAI